MQLALLVRMNSDQTSGTTSLDPGSRITMIEPFSIDDHDDSDTPVVVESHFGPGLDRSMTPSNNCIDPRLLLVSGQFGTGDTVQRAGLSVMRR